MSIILSLFSHSAFAAKRTYDLHLSFQEEEFVDVLVLETKGLYVKGEMHVPNDFSGPLLNILKFGGQIAFDLFVPKNHSRIKDMVFEYRGFYSDNSEKKLIGFVRIKGKPETIATFVAFEQP
jgi:hypothetical protein